MHNLRVYACLLLGLCLCCPAMSAQTEYYHPFMTHCDKCHYDGVPSASFDFEVKKCMACHGKLDKQGGKTHQLHATALRCVDCHEVHTNLKAEGACEECHLDSNAIITTR